MRRILITGGNGNICKNFLKNYTISNTKFVVLTRNPSPVSSHRDIEFIKFDFLRSNGLEEKLWNANEIVHMAGVTHEKDPNKYFEVNCGFTEKLVNLAKLNKITRFIYMSTQAVGKKGGAYSQSKEIAEKIVKESNLNWTILRPSEIYGNECKSSIETVDQFIINSKFVPIIGAGNYMINPLHIDDFINFFKSVIGLHPHQKLLSNLHSKWSKTDFI